MAKKTKGRKMDKKAKIILEKSREARPEKKRCTLYLKKEIFSEIHAVCKHESRSISQIVEILIGEFLESYKKDKANNYKK